jgi:hypothetical protein
MAKLIYEIVSVAAVMLAIKEVGLPLGILSALLALFFSIFSGLAWDYILFPKDINLRNGPILYVAQIFSIIVAAAIPLVAIVVIPGPTPEGLLVLASAYAFLNVLFGRPGLGLRRPPPPSA